MELSTRALLTSIIGILGAVGLFGLTIYPFEYGVVESSVLVGALVIAALLETVLDDTSF